MSTNHVNTVIKNYKKERWIHNSNRLGKEDSLSVWYSIEELEECVRFAANFHADSQHEVDALHARAWKLMPRYGEAPTYGNDPRAYGNKIQVYT